VDESDTNRENPNPFGNDLSVCKATDGPQLVLLFSVPYPVTHVSFETASFNITSGHSQNLPNPGSPEIDFEMGSQGGGRNFQVPPVCHFSKPFFLAEYLFRLRSPFTHYDCTSQSWMKPQIMLRDPPNWANPSVHYLGKHPEPSDSLHVQLGDYS